MMVKEGNLKMFCGSEGVESKESHLSLARLWKPEHDDALDVMPKTDYDKSPLVYDVYTPPHLSLTIYLTEEGLHKTEMWCSVSSAYYGARHVLHSHDMMMMMMPRRLPRLMRHYNM